MLHNIGLDYEANTPIIEAICEHTGGIGVGIFFFLSAFGITRSYQIKGNKYLLKLIFVNIPKLFLISFVINLLIYFVYHQGQFETTDLFLRLFNLDVFNDFNRMNRHGWYISTIIGMYLIFVLIYFICSKLKTDKKFLIAGFIMAFLAISFRIGALIADKGGMYTREMPCFAIGCIYAMYYDKINKLFNKYFYQGLVLFIIAIIIGLFLFEPVGAYGACLFIILVSQRITYKNQTMHFLGKICIYLYLFVHFTQLGLQPYRENQYWWTLTNLGLGLILSLLLHLAFYLVFEGIKKIKNYLLKKKML
jgi:peptidoglycan/LPS O-acetylase OafA/YrhL